MPDRPDFRSNLAQWLTGFLGSLLIVAALPTLFRFLTRRLFGFFALEAIGIALAGLLLQRGSGILSRRPRR